MPTPVLSVENLVKVFGKQVAVNGISFSVQPGEFFSLLGPSGCGKTTTLRIVAGFEEPTSGRVLLQGRPVEGMPPYRRNVNTVFQHYALFPHLSVADNVAFGLRVKGTPAAEAKRRVEEMLRMVRLEAHAYKRPTQLSGGEQQRVALVRALINHPALLLLDEPLGALDLKLRKQMQLELTNIQRQVGIAFVYVTHDQEEALAMSDRVAVMNQGRIAQIGSPVELYERPRSRFVADFIGENNLLMGRVVGAERGAVLLEVAGFPLLRVAMEAGPPQGATLTLCLRPEKLRVVAASEQGPDNIVSGRVERSVYQGSKSYLYVRLASGAELLAALPGAVALEPGAEVSLGWAAEDATPLAEELAAEGAATRVAVPSATR